MLNRPLNFLQMPYIHGKTYKFYFLYAFKTEFAKQQKLIICLKSKRNETLASGNFKKMAMKLFSIIFIVGYKTFMLLQNYMQLLDLTYNIQLSYPLLFKIC